MRSSISQAKQQHTVTVLVRPLNVYIPDKDCDPEKHHPKNTAKRTAGMYEDNDYCHRLSDNEYRQQLESTLRNYKILYTDRQSVAKKPFCPKLWYHDELAGKTNGLDDAEEKQSFNATLFGVEVWESFDMTLLDFMKQHIGADKESQAYYDLSLFFQEHKEVHHIRGQTLHFVLGPICVRSREIRKDVGSRRWRLVPLEYRVHPL